MEKKIYNYLNDLRDSGITNMFGAEFIFKMNLDLVKEKPENFSQNG